MYKFLLRPLLFQIDPERIHHFTFGLIQFISAIPGVKWIWRSVYCINDPVLERKILGMTFQNPVGLAAGFDKNAQLIDPLTYFGFGFIEIGTVTPFAQPGNDRPRLFRLEKDLALINRMGFNNEGVQYVVERLKKRNSGIIIGGNIGKNKSTPNAQAVEDYLTCFERLFPHVDYFVVNVSSPNTAGLRDLQEKGPLKELLQAIRGANLKRETPKPVLLKIAPDLTVGQLDDVVEILKETRTDGIIATNTTISREGLSTSEAVVNQIGAGGLSGKPLNQKSTEVIKYLRSQLGPDFPIIGVGGIMTVEDAMDKLKAGADLIQIYTGFIYEGPGFVKRINQALRRKG